MKRVSRYCCLAIAVAMEAVAATRAPAQELRIAAAADLRFALEEMTGQFRKQTQIIAKVTYGSSGTFFAQIQNGAPFDLFLSADAEYPEKLEALSLVEPGSRYEYAVGGIVIWMPREAKIRLKNIGWNSLLDSAVEKIAIANPQHAPYGRAAITALQKAGIYDRVKTKLVYGENISQAAQFAESGSAQAGILARSLVLSDEMKDGQLWEIPREMHLPIEQSAVVLKNAQNKPAARSFLEFLKSASCRQILEKYGFTVPQPAASRVGQP